MKTDFSDLRITVQKCDMPLMDVTLASMFDIAKMCNLRENVLTFGDITIRFNFDDVKEKKRKWELWKNTLRRLWL